MEPPCTGKFPNTENGKLNLKIHKFMGYPSPVLKEWKCLHTQMNDYNNCILNSPQTIYTVHALTVCLHIGCYGIWAKETGKGLPFDNCIYEELCWQLRFLNFTFRTLLFGFLNKKVYFSPSALNCINYLFMQNLFTGLLGEVLMKH